MPTTDEVKAQKKVDELKKQIFFLEETVDTLQKTRGGLENEIADARKAYKAKLDEEHSKRMEALATEYQEHGKKQDEQQKYLDNYLIRLDKQAAEQKETAKEQGAKETAIENAAKEFAKERAYAIKQITGQKKVLDGKETTLIEEKKSVDITREAQAKERVNLDTKALNIETEKGGVLKLIAMLDNKKSENLAVLDSIRAVYDKTAEENKSMREVLVSIEEEKKELIALSVYKDELVKIEAARKALAEKEKTDLARAALVDKREADVLERETANTEKDKYLIIKEREVIRLMNKKIAILKKLREGE